MDGITTTDIDFNTYIMKQSVDALRNQGPDLESHPRSSAPPTPPSPPPPGAER